MPHIQNSVNCAVNEIARLRASLLCAALLLMHGGSLAANACSISVQDMVFDAYDPSSKLPLDSVAEVAIDCTRPVPVTLQLGPSRVTGSVADRRMRHLSRSAEALGYNLFSDPSRTRVWGDGARGSASALHIERRGVVRIYGRIFPGQEPWVGTYEDAVSITILP
jgi:spore coat protein U-like protein